MMLAYELQKDVDQILAMSPDEFYTWLAFFKLTGEMRKAENTQRGGRNGNKFR